MPSELGLQKAHVLEMRILKIAQPEKLGEVEVHIPGKMGREEDGVSIELNAPKAGIIEETGAGEGGKSIEDCISEVGLPWKRAPANWHPPETWPWRS